MNADRLIRMVLNRLLRQGMKRLSKDGKPDPNVAQAQKAVRNLNRIRRM
jgi:hypothetical protein